jgi:hypothetical protein
LTCCLFFSSTGYREIGFFQFYIIPLARKLKDCGVFGVSSDEYLNYAEKNLKEWEREGQEVTATMVEKFRDVDFAQEAKKEAERAVNSSLSSNAHVTHAREAMAAAAAAAAAGNDVNTNKNNMIAI